MSIWEILAGTSILVFTLFFGWDLWFRRPGGRIKDEHYGDLEYSPKPAVVTVDRMDLLMAEIRRYAEMLANPEAIEIDWGQYEDYELSLSESGGWIVSALPTADVWERLEREATINTQWGKVWKLADEITAEGRFHVKQIEPSIYESQRHALNSVWNNLP